MALVAATITVNFTSNYTGQHRVCYRFCGSGGYTCINVSCTGGGAACSATIPITVDNETCPVVCFEGYIQATCQDISSLTDRIPFTVSFTPNPACKRYKATCNTAGIATVTMVNKGTGYTVGSSPSVSFSGGGGTGATATSAVGSGKILTTGITFISGGSGYVNGTYNNVPIDGSAAGTGGLGTFTVTAGVVVLGTVTTPGDGYANPDTLFPRASSLGGSTPGVVATFNVSTDRGTVTGITVTAPGAGYTSAPTLTIAPPPSGTTATATANLGYCVGFTVNSCIGTGSPVLDNQIQPGQVVDFCTAGTPPAPTNYTVVQDTGNCLCNCQTTTIAATVGSINYRYTACNGAIVGGTLAAAGSPSSLTVCAVTGSVFIVGVVNPGAPTGTGTITNLGAC